MGFANETDTNYDDEEQTTTTYEGQQTNEKVKLNKIETTGKRNTVSNKQTIKSASETSSEEKTTTIMTMR